MVLSCLRTFAHVAPPIWLTLYQSAPHMFPFSDCSLPWEMLGPLQSPYYCTLTTLGISRVGHSKAHKFTRASLCHAQYPAQCLALSKIDFLDFHLNCAFFDIVFSPNWYRAPFFVPHMILLLAPWLTIITPFRQQWHLWTRSHSHTHNAWSICHSPKLPCHQDTLTLGRSCFLPENYKQNIGGCYVKQPLAKLDLGLLEKWGKM